MLSTSPITFSQLCLPALPSGRLVMRSLYLVESESQILPASFVAKPEKIVFPRLCTAALSSLPPPQAATPAARARVALHRATERASLVTVTSWCSLVESGAEYGYP